MKTWQDIENASLTDPYIRQMLILIEMGATREQALIQAVLAMASGYANLQTYAINLLNTRMQPIILVRPEKP